ncbi:MAG: hypothetical protein M1832_001112 [Thelocarpon impressellum]|nr:MAG: hypothetical protein M1832_001112 [Thelocarpon impressellum]
MIIGEVESLMHVDMLKGLKKMDDGATVKEYAAIPALKTDYASQVVVDEAVSEDQRFLEKGAMPIEEEFPEGTRAIFRGEFNYGRTLEIVRHQNSKVEAWVSIIKGREPDFGRECARNAERTTPYTPSNAVARMLSLNPLVLSKITSAFSVMLDGSRLNLGLNLKFESKKLKVLGGYSRRSASGWEFSQKAVELVQQYMVSFPEFIAGIQRKPQGDMYHDTDFYPAETSKAKLKEIQAWLKTVESKGFEKVPVEAEQLDSDVVKQIELAGGQATAKSAGMEGKKIKGVPRNALLKPSDAGHRLGNQRFSLGERVVYVHDSGRVPIATNGMVVGLTRTSRTTLWDIVFDVSFMSGMSLGDKCSPFRGSTVPVASVLNITDRQLVVGSRAAADKRPQQAPQPLTVNGHGAPTGAGGRGQYVEARAPAPLRGSFSGAVAGQPNRGRAWTGGPGRGRGGGLGSSNANFGGQQGVPMRGRGQAASAQGQRGSHINGYGSEHTQANGSSNGYNGATNPGRNDGVQSQAQPQQSYTNMPPPASLNARPRGRGDQRGNGYISPQLNLSDTQPTTYPTTVKYTYPEPSSASGTTYPAHSNVGNVGDVFTAADAAYPSPDGSMRTLRRGIPEANPGGSGRGTSQTYPT